MIKVGQTKLTYNTTEAAGRYVLVTDDFTFFSSEEKGPVEDFNDDRKYGNQTEFLLELFGEDDV